MTQDKSAIAYEAELAYSEWMETEGIPVYETMGGVRDVLELPRRPWARMGGLGTFIQMMGTTEAERGVYVVEIPGGGALNPERHLYDEALLVLQGRGLTEIWLEGAEQKKTTFEWGEGSLFAPPLNTWHRLVTGSREPALLLAVTTAPQSLLALRDPEFIFNCDHSFKGVFENEANYFNAGEDRRKPGKWQTLWYTNFIPDVRAAFLDDMERKVAGGQVTGYRMERNFPEGHMSEWPAGRYHKAHFHAPGAILAGLKGKGYVLLWDHQLGIHPYQDGHEDQVVRIEWGSRSIYSPPDGWFHQHFNNGREPARHVAVYGRGGVMHAKFQALVGGDFIGFASTEEGGTLINYENEDPEIRRRFEEELKREGIEFTMPPVTYR